MSDQQAHSATDILISGAGTPGLALALLLANTGLSVTLVDPAPLSRFDAGPDGRTSALMNGSVNILRATGGWNAAAGYGERLEILRIVDANGPGAPVSVDFEAGEIGFSQFGVNMPNNALTAALAQTALAHDRIQIVQTVVDAFDPTPPAAHVVLADGQAIRCALVIGADGRKSPVRDLSGIAVESHDYGQSAITCLLDHTRPHGNISTEFHRPAGPFTLVPLPGNRSSLVWVESRADAESLLRLPKQSFTKRLQELSQDALGEITLATPPSAFPLISQTACDIVADRVALVAEAAHVLHPIGAQGLNLSLRDVASLAEVIADARRLGQDIGSARVLANYAARRRHDLASRLVGTNGLNRLVSNDLGILRALRQTGLKTIGSVAPLRRFAMKQGLAPALDDSRLARGEAL